MKGTWRAAFEVESRRPFWWYRIRGRRTSVPYFPESNLEPVNFEKKGTLTDDCFTLKLSGDELGLQDNNSTYYLSKTINVSLSLRMNLVLEIEITVSNRSSLQSRNKGQVLRPTEHGAPESSMKACVSIRPSTNRVSVTACLTMVNCGSTQLMGLRLLTLLSSCAPLQNSSLRKKKMRRIITTVGLRRAGRLRRFPIRTAQLPHPMTLVLSVSNCFPPIRTSFRTKLRLVVDFFYQFIRD